MCIVASNEKYCSSFPPPRCQNRAATQGWIIKDLAAAKDRSSWISFGLNSLNETKFKYKLSFKLVPSTAGEEMYVAVAREEKDLRAQILPE